MAVKENIYTLGCNDSTYPECSVQDICNFLDSVSVFCVDTETTGLDPHTSDIIMLQVGNEKYQFVIDARVVDVDFIFPYLEDSSKTKIGSNLKFDYKMFLGNYNIRMQNMFDTMIVEMILECGVKSFGFGLAKLAEKYVKFHMPKDVRNEFTIIRKQEFNSRQIQYGGRDVLIPMYIYWQQQKRIKKDELGMCVYLENKFVAVCAEMEYHGMYVDKELWLDLHEKNKKALIQAEIDLNSYLIENKMVKYLGPIDMFTQEITILVSWTSQKQVVPIFKDLGVPTQIFDKEKSKEASELLGYKVEKFKDSIGKVEMQKYISHPFVNLYLSFKKYQKAVSTYGENWYKDYVNTTTKRVHTNFRQILNTGRLASSKPNVQQIPSFKSKDKPFSEAHRTCFVAPEGRRLIVRDFSGCELRILADYSRESSMQNEFIHGVGDLHSLTATKVYTQINGVDTPVNKDENSHLRQVGKVLNFALSYGASAFKIAQQLAVDESEGSKIVKSFYKAFPMLEDYFKGQHSFVKSHGYVLIDNYTKRRSYFPYYKEYLQVSQALEEYQNYRAEARNMGMEEPEFPRKLYSNYMKMRGSMERASQNYRIQGTNASMTKIAMIKMYDYILDNKLQDKAAIVLSLHDEIVLEADEDIADELDSKLSEFMIFSGTLFCPKVPMEVDGGVSTVWDH